MKCKTRKTDDFHTLLTVGGNTDMHVKHFSAKTAFLNDKLKDNACNNPTATFKEKIRWSASWKKESTA